jgi:hypothetical protein
MLNIPIFTSTPLRVLEERILEYLQILQMILNISDILNCCNFRARLIQLADYHCTTVLEEKNN